MGEKLRRERPQGEETAEGQGGGTVGKGARGLVKESWSGEGGEKGCRVSKAEGGASGQEEGGPGQQYLASAAWSGWQSGRGVGSVGSGSSY